MTFQELHLLPELLRAVGDVGYAEPSPIQAQAIPPVMAGRDLIGCAQTGTGKTAAFAIPILQRLQEEGNFTHRPVRALVLTPTRELALQIKESFDAYGKYLPLRTTVVFGGVSQVHQVEELQRGTDILVATPGRLNDLCAQGHIDLGGISCFVLDEADRMLDMGFIHDVRKVIARLPRRRQTLLFSATMPEEIVKLTRQILHQPVTVEVTPVSSTVDAIEQSVYKVDKANKRRLLLHLLQNNSWYSVLVFTATKHGADRVAKELCRQGIGAVAIHGNKSQNARVRALESFKSGESRVLVATDIAARGIDINELSCGINFDLPNVPETYVHRIGRTGRAGRDGVAVSFCCFDELPYLKDIQALIGKQVPEVTDHPYPMEVFASAPKAERPPRREKGRRPDQREEKPKGRSEEKRGRRSSSPAAKQEKGPACHQGGSMQREKKGGSAVPRSAAPPAEMASPRTSWRKADGTPPPRTAAKRPRPVRSGGPAMPGHVVAVADGRRKRK